MDAELDTEILSIKIEEMKILCYNKIIHQFDNDPKHINLRAYEFYQ